MSGNPWSKFFWQDWESDQALKLCSLAAQGLWMRMLCIAAAHDPVGYVSVAGKPLDETGLARLTGASESEVAILLQELDQHGVFSRDRHGRIYSRRLIRDARKASEAKKNGKEGGNPKIRRGTVPKGNRVRPYRRSDSPAKTRRIFEKGGGRCHWCKTDLVWDSEDLVPNLFHVDHVVAVCDGGKNDEDNLVSACAACNHARARKDWENPSDTNPDTNPDTKPHKPEARSQSNSSSKEKELQKARAPEKPDGIPDQVWADFLGIRKAKRAPLTVTALAGIQREAEIAGWSLPDALAECATRGWQAFKAEWVRPAHDSQTEAEKFGEMW